MSYDVNIGDAEFNITSNISRLFYDHIFGHENGGGLRELNGLTGKEAVEVLSNAFHRIHRTQIECWRENDVGDPAFCAKYDADNGWGSTVGGLIFLAQLLGACAQNPRKKVRVHC